MQERVHTRVEVAVGDRSRDRHDEPGGRSEQRLIDARREIRGRREAALRREIDEGVDQSGDRAEQP